MDLVKKCLSITAPVFFGYISIGIPFGLLMANAGYEWWSMSPVGYGYSGTYVKSVENGGSLESSINNAPFGLRPVISLSSLNRIISGSGSEVDPWIVG